MIPKSIPDHDWQLQHLSTPLWVYLFKTAVISLATWACKVGTVLRTNGSCVSHKTDYCNRPWLAVHYPNTSHQSLKDGHHKLLLFFSAGLSIQEWTSRSHFAHYTFSTFTLVFGPALLLTIKHKAWGKKLWHGRHNIDDGSKSRWIFIETW